MGDTDNSSAAASISTADEMAGISKIEPGREDTPSSIESTPEPSADADTAAQDPALPQKRKGGRKPIYATSEERKQRNRQAQAAFRERRTEYIKQLEAQIKQNEDALHTLQQSHRSAADECLMLRYKNSLLERILLEKGIDVQAELQVKTGSPAMAPSHLPQHIPNPPVQPALQRAAVNRQHARRSLQGMPPRASSSGMPQPISHENSFSVRSPQQPTPSSHASSPTAMSINSAGSVAQDVMTPPASAILAQGPLQQHRLSQHQQQQHSRNHYMMQHPAQRPIPQAQYPGSSGMSSVSSASSQGLGGQANTGTASASAYYPSPFQKHIDQLEQEYDAPPHSMIDMDQEAHEQRSFGTAANSDQYREQYHGMTQPPMQYMQAPPKMPTPDGGQQIDSSGQYPPMGQMFDQFDPILDADPFGLSASMHFPTNYSFDQTHQR